MGNFATIWIKFLYGKPLKQLEEVYAQFEVEGG